VLAQRIGQRLRNLAAITDLGPGLPDIGAALAADPRPGSGRSLLHMDLRPENVLARRSRLTAILDMLSHVFLDGAPDPVKAGHYIERAKTPCRVLTGGTPG
jgi:hypothetical protein